MNNLVVIFLGNGVWWLGKRDVAVSFRNRMSGGISYFWFCLVWQVGGEESAGENRQRGTLHPKHEHPNTEQKYSHTIQNTPSRFQETYSILPACLRELDSTFIVRVKELKKKTHRPAVSRDATLRNLVNTNKRRNYVINTNT
jgi:hypothetical protein